MISGQIKAVLFDFDGTMVDSELLHLKAWQIILSGQKHSLTDIPPTTLAKMFGKKPLSNSRKIIKLLDLKTSPKSLLKSKTEIFINLINTKLKLMPGLLKSLKSLKKSGYKLAICSSGQIGYINLILNKFNLSNYFDVVIDGDQVRLAKPNPKIYLKACHALSLNPNECIVIEDSWTGIESASRAGMICFAIKNPALVQDLSNADKIISNLDEITNKEIAKSIKK